MPILKNPKHEAFAQAVVAGKTLREAYIKAGYRYDSGNATRLLRVATLGLSRMRADRRWRSRGVD